jgi:AcrR family transcriptional regulator
MPATAAAKRPNETLSERRRNSILVAARTVFSGQGYTVATVDDVANEAGIAKGTLYLYFRSKEEIYLAALTQDLVKMAQKARDQMEQATSLRDQIRAFVRVRLEYCQQHEEFLRIYLAEYGSMFVKARPLPREFHDLFRQNVRYLSKLIERAIRAGEIRAVPPGPTAAAVVDLTRGMTEKRLLGWTELQAENEVDFILDLLWAGIKPGRNRIQRKRRI